MEWKSCLVCPNYWGRQDTISMPYNDIVNLDQLKTIDIYIYNLLLFGSN